MKISFEIQGKKINKIYSEYLFSKNKKFVIKDNYINFNTNRILSIDIIVADKNMNLICEDVNIRIKYDEINTIEKFDDFIIIENRVMAIVIPQSSFKNRKKSRTFFRFLKVLLILINMA